jgi:Tol biopolymer transport system component
MEGMSKTVVVIGSMAAALAAVGVLGLVEVLPAEAAFPGKNGKIAFQSDRGGSYEIYTMNRNGTKIDKLTTNPAPDEDPAFSPEGNKIAFESDRDGDSDIYKMTVKGHRLVPLTTDPATTFGADWAVR